MSEIKRYTFLTGINQEHKTGEWVKYEDILKTLVWVLDQRAKVLRLCECVANLPATWLNSDNGMFECPHCKRTIRDFHADNGLEAMKKIKHASNCDYLLAKQLKEELIRE